MYIPHTVNSPYSATAHPNLWQYMKGGSKSKYCTIGNSLQRLSWALSEGGTISGFDCTRYLTTPSVSWHPQRQTIGRPMNKEL